MADVLAISRAGLAPLAAVEDVLRAAILDAYNRLPEFQGDEALVKDEIDDMVIEQLELAPSRDEQIICALMSIVLAISALRMLEAGDG